MCYSRGVGLPVEAVEVEALGKRFYFVSSIQPSKEF